MMDAMSDKKPRGLGRGLGALLDSAGRNPAGVSTPAVAGGRIYVSLQGTDQLVVIDTGTGRVIGQVAVGLKPVGVAASL